MAQSNIDIIIQAQDKTATAFNSAQGGLSGFKDRIDSMQPAFQNMAKVGTVAFAAIAGVAVTSFNAFSEAEAQTAVSTKSLENTITAMTDKQRLLYAETGKTSDVLKEVSEAMGIAGKSAVKMGFDDETAANSFARLFAVTKDSEQANKELSVAMDLARSKGISLEDATQKLIMVHSGSTKELKLMGLAVDENATAMQNLDSIAAQASGSAEAFANTTAGATQTLQVTLGNLQESIGGALAPAVAKLLEKVTPMIEKFATWAENNPDLLAKIILVAGAIAGLVTVVGLLGMALPAVIAGFALLTGPIGLVIAIIGVLMFTVMQVVKIFQILRDDGDLIWLGIQTMVTEKIEAIKAVIAKVTAVIKEAWISTWTSIKTFFVGIWTGIADAAKAAMDKVKAYIDPVLKTIEKALNKLQEIGGAVTGGIKKAVSKVVNVDDAVISPSGTVVSTHPDDYLIATKDPSSLGGGGGTFNININGAIFTQDAARTLGDLIIGDLNMQMRGS